MQDSVSLQLFQHTAGINLRIAQHVAAALKAGGFADVKPSVLQFLGALDCGVNYGSEIARHLGVSRQMVTKTVKQLCSAGYLEQCPGAGRQKKIVFTPTGELLMSRAREVLAALDEQLQGNAEPGALQEVVQRLEALERQLGDV